MAAPARDRIVRAADELFHERSIQGVGIDAIIERAGVAKMSLYHHFRSKDELVAAYLRERDERVTPQIIADARGRARTPVRRALAYFDAVADRVGPHYRGCPFLNAVAELGALPDHPAVPVVQAHKERVRAYFEEQLAEAGAKDPKGASQALLVILNGALVTAMVYGTNQPVKTARQVAERYLESVLG